MFLLAAVHIYRRLGRELEPTHRAYGLSIDVDGDRPIELEQLAAEYVRILERAQPEGPYRLAGFSFGGILAFEVAQQLRKKGREVAHLFLIDALLPAPREDFGEVWRRFLELPLRKRARALASEAVAVVLGPRPMKPRDLNADRVRAMDELRTRRYLDATSAYAERLLPYDGPATVVVAQRRVGQTLRFDAFCGWRRKIQTLARVAVDADHLEMLGEGAVQDVAAGMIRAKSA